MNDITDFIPEGKSNAITRNQLCNLTGLSDRKVRELIEQARSEGEIIINAQDGAGYFRTEDLNEIEKQYKRNDRRAKSILVQQKHLRKRLKTAGLL
jgi:DNA-binding transcriptional regulator LsrR (DeoR family)